MKVDFTTFQSPAKIIPLSTTPPSVSARPLGKQKHLPTWAVKTLETASIWTIHQTAQLHKAPFITDQYKINQHWHLNSLLCNHVRSLRAKAARPWSFHACPSFPSHVEHSQDQRLDIPHTAFHSSGVIEIHKMECWPLTFYRNKKTVWTQRNVANCHTVVNG